MTEKTAEVDQAKGATLEQISSMVEQIGREFKSKQAQLQPLMAELKVLVALILFSSLFRKSFMLCFIIERSTRLYGD